MIKIMRGPGTGKTKELLEYCEKNNCTMVCKNPAAMIEKSEAYGIYKVPVVSYIWYLQYSQKDKKYIIDDIDDFIEEMGFSSNIVGYGGNL